MKDSDSPVDEIRDTRSSVDDSADGDASRLDGAVEQQVGGLDDDTLHTDHDSEAGTATVADDTPATCQQSGPTARDRDYRNLTAEEAAGTYTLVRPSIL